jgi:hypothetical protein
LKRRQDSKALPDGARGTNIMSLFEWPDKNRARFSADMRSNRTVIELEDSALEWNMAMPDFRAIAQL